MLVRLPAARQRNSTCWLICLDLQRDCVIPGRPRYVAGAANIATICAGVLAHARNEGWRVVHSQVRDPRSLAAQAFDAPIEGLRPLITEPVYFRSGLSAFANPEFAAEMLGACGEETFLIGFSLADSCLATALAGVDAGLRMTVVEDAMGPGEARAAAATRTVLEPFVEFTSSRRLRAHGLEVVS
jgi:nicotinamidase-related amidase